MVSPRGIVAGQYNDAPAFSGSCTIVNYALQTGRTQSILECVEDNRGYHLGITLVNGAVNTGHPYYAQLHSAGIDKHIDVRNYIWGITTVGSSQNSLGGCGHFGSSSRPIGAQQVGNALRLTLFNNDGTFACTGQMNKVQ